MQLSDLKILLDTIGVSVAFHAFKKPQALPYIVFITPGADNMAADGKVYYSTPRVQVELYTAAKDTVLEGKVESALSSFFWQKDEGYLDDEQMYMVTYQFTL